MYQNLRIIIGHKFLNKWVKNNEFIIDYFDAFKEKLENKYNKENAEKVIDIVSKISVLLTLKFETTKVDEISSKKRDIEKQLEKIENKSKFIEEKTKEKNKITKKIKEIDTIINNKEIQKVHGTVLSARDKDVADGCLVPVGRWHSPKGLLPSGVPKGSRGNPEIS